MIFLTQNWLHICFVDNIINLFSKENNYKWKLFIIINFLFTNYFFIVNTNKFKITIIKYALILSKINKFLKHSNTFTEHNIIKTIKVSFSQFNPDCHILSNQCLKIIITIQTPFRRHKYPTNEIKLHQTTSLDYHKYIIG